MRVTTARLVTGTVRVSMPWSAIARTVAQPKNVPMASPSAVPNTAMMIDSQRTVERTCDRPMPTARSRPEFTGPLEDRQRQRVGDAEQSDHDGQHQQGVEQPEHGVDLGTDEIEEAVLVQHVGRPVGRGDAADRRLVTRDVDPVVERVATVRRRASRSTNIEPTQSVPPEKIASTTSEVSPLGNVTGTFVPIVQPCSAACSAETAMPSAPSEPRSPSTVTEHEHLVDGRGVEGVERIRRRTIDDRRDQPGLGDDVDTIGGAQFVGQVGAQP